MEDENGLIWVGVHFGSRGFGHKTAAGFGAHAQGLALDARAQEGEMDSPPVLFEVGSELGESYVAATELAGEGADSRVTKVLRGRAVGRVIAVARSRVGARQCCRLVRDQLGELFCAVRGGDGRAVGF